MVLRFSGLTDEVWYAILSLGTIGFDRVEEVLGVGRGAGGLVKNRQSHNWQRSTCFPSGCLARPSRAKLGNRISANRLLASCKKEQAYFGF